MTEAQARAFYTKVSAALEKLNAIKKFPVEYPVLSVDAMKARNMLQSIHDELAPKYRDGKK